MTFNQLVDAIVVYRRRLASDSSDERYAENLYQARSEAWRAAFEWRDAIESTAVGAMSMRRRDEYNEGMRLIHEKLR